MTASHRLRIALHSTAAPVAYASAPPALDVALGPLPAGYTGYSAQPGRATAEQVAQTRAAVSEGRVTAGFDTDEMLKRAPDTASMVEYWDLSDCLIDGHNAMKLAGSKYLPRFDDEKDGAYQMRLALTKFTNIFRDIVESLSAKPFEQEVSLVGENIPAEIAEFIEDVDGSGNNLTVFAGATFFNAVASAIDWIWIDFPKHDPNIRNRAQEKAAGIRPNWSHVLGRNVLVARSKVINGRETLVYLKVFEPSDGAVADRVRIFERLPTGVIWTLYEKSETEVNGKTRFVEIEAGTISIGVIPFVPFFTGRRDGRTFRIFPAMRDAADLQVQLYQDESGLKYAKTLTAYPMLAGNGVKPDKDAGGGVKEIKVGPSRVLYAPPNNNGDSGSWTYVEPSATSLKFLSEDNKETIAQLRELGRQPLTAQSGNLTTITAATAAGKARSAVGAWALWLKDALENALVMTAMWLAVSYDPEVNVYTEFDQFTEGKDLEVLISCATATNPILSAETVRDEMKRRGVLSPEFKEDKERERLLEQTSNEPEEPEA